MISSDTDLYVAGGYNVVKWILSKSSKLFINMASNNSILTYLIVVLRKLFYRLGLSLPCLNRRLSLFYPILSYPILSYPILSYPILS